MIEFKNNATGKTEIAIPLFSIKTKEDFDSLPEITMIRHTLPTIDISYIKNIEKYFPRPEKQRSIWLLGKDYTKLADENNIKIGFYTNYDFLGGFKEYAKVIFDYLSLVFYIKGYLYYHGISEHVGYIELELN